MAFPTGWLFSNKITVKTGQVPSSLTNKEVFIDHTVIRLARPEMITAGDPDSALSDGADVRISTDAAGTIQCSVEIARFELNANPNLSKVAIWAKLPSIADGTEFYIWWGKSDATMDGPDDPFGSRSVWSSYTTLVYHGEEDLSSENLINSKSADFTGVPSASSRSEGKVGYTSYYSLDESYVGIPDTGNALQMLETDTFLISWWQKYDSPHQPVVTFHKGASWPGYPDFSNLLMNYQIRDWPDQGGLQAAFLNTSNNFEVITLNLNNNPSVLQDTNWHHVMVYVDFDDHTVCKCFIDGMDLTNIYNHTGSWNTTPKTDNSDLEIGSQYTELGSPPDRYNGILGMVDEFRFSKNDSTILPNISSWATTSYNNENSTTGFMELEGSVIPPLDVPILTSPINGITIIFEPTVFTWGNVDLATNYDIEVATDIDFNNIVFNDNVSGTTANTTLSTPDTYYWRIKAKNDTTESNFSSVGIFLLSLNPIQSSPANGGTVEDTTITFKWGEVVDSLSYQLQVATDIDFNDIFADVEENLSYFNIVGGIISTDLSDFERGTTYYWRVRSNTEEVVVPPPSSSCSGDEDPFCDSADGPDLDSYWTAAGTTTIDSISGFGGDFPTPPSGSYRTAVSGNATRNTECTKTEIRALLSLYLEFHSNSPNPTDSINNIGDDQPHAFIFSLDGNTRVGYDVSLNGPDVSDVSVSVKRRFIVNSVEIFSETIFEQIGLDLTTESLPLTFSDSVEFVLRNNGSNIECEIDGINVGSSPGSLDTDVGFGLITSAEDNLSGSNWKYLIYGLVDDICINSPAAPPP